MKKIFLLFTVALFFSSCFPGEKTESQSDFIKVVIANRTFKIPRGYLDGRKAWGKDTESIVLEYSLPGFEVLPPYPQERGIRQELLSAGRLRGMLLEASVNRPSFDDMVEGSLHANPLLSEPVYKDMTAKIYGLEKYVCLEKNGSKNTP